jgi:hypothetical protein
MSADPPPEDSLQGDPDQPAAVEGLVRDVTAMRDGRRITYYSRAVREGAR